MAEFSKSFKGKKLKAFAQAADGRLGEAFTATGYCPWCSEVKRTGQMTSEKRAANFAFQLLESHWNVMHKNQK